MFKRLHVHTFHTPSLESFNDQTTQPLPTDSTTWEIGVPYQYLGLTIVLEYLKGNIRTGPGWEHQMPDAYGYIDGTKDADGEDIDVYLCYQFDPNASPVIVDQKNLSDGTFDEHKCMLGYTDPNTAITTYIAAFGDGKGKDRIQGSEIMSPQSFVNWVVDGDHTLPVASTPPTPVSDTTDIINDRLIKLVSPGDSPIIICERVDGRRIVEIYIMSNFSTDKWGTSTETIIRILRSATPDDWIIFGISSFGGELDLAARIASAMRASKARITTVSLGAVASAGCLIWSEGQDRQITAGSYFMQHMSIQGQVGKTTAIARATTASAAYVKDVIFSRVQEIGLFTEQELSDMVDKEKDIFISAFEAAQRTQSKVIG